MRELYMQKLPIATLTKAADKNKMELRGYMKVLSLFDGMILTYGCNYYTIK
jgi:hypothetical protein